jgi:hypothetical protein
MGRLIAAAGVEKTLFLLEGFAISLHSFLSWSFAVLTISLGTAVTASTPSESAWRAYLRVFRMERGEIR